MSRGKEFTDLFSEGAAHYALYRPVYPLALVDYLADLAPSNALAWDCGCGSGQLSTVLAERFDHVIATDASAEQIAMAERHQRVSYRVARAEACGLDSATADLTVAAQAAHWFDREAFYAEARRVSRIAVGAVIALVTYNLMRIEPQIDAVVDEFYWNALAPHWPRERRLVDDGYRSVAFPFTEVMAPEMAIVSHWSFSDVRGYIGSWSAIRAMAKGGGMGQIEGFLAALRDAWGDPDLVRAVIAPIAMRVGRID